MFTRDEGLSKANVNLLKNSVDSELDSIQAQVQSTWEVEHDLDGTHTDIHADSVTVDGAISGDSLTGDDITCDNLTVNVLATCERVEVGPGASADFEASTEAYAFTVSNGILGVIGNDDASGRQLLLEARNTATADQNCDVYAHAVDGAFSATVQVSASDSANTSAVRFTVHDGNHLYVQPGSPGIEIGGNLDVSGGLNIGSGNVDLVGSDGKINGPLSSTIIDDLSGANLTTLNGSNISSGTVADARLSSNVALKNTDNSFSANQTISKSSARFNLTNTAGGGEKIIQLASDTQTGFQLSKDSTPSTAIWWGLSNPGGADGDDHVWSTFNGSAFTQRMTLLTTGQLKLAGTAVRATTEGTNHLDIFDGTAPAGTLANGISLYSTSGELRVMDAAGNPTLLSPHDKNGFWIFESRSGLTGKMFTVHMEKMIRRLNEVLGGGFIEDE